MINTPIAPLQVTAPPAQAYHLTPEQIEFFDREGYLIIRNCITGDLLTRLQAAGAAWIQQGLNAAAEDAEKEDYHYAKRKHGEVMFRVNYVHSKKESVSLDLLGSPQVMGIAESLCGINFVPTYESMVFKQENDGEKIMWHQDAVHPRNARIFNLDLYLDASTADAGALRVVPKSQTQGADVCALQEAYGWNPPGTIIAEMQPGDVLLHDVMVVHGSPETEGKALRRTIYYEFRAAEQIMSEGPWDADWVDKRIRLVPLGLESYKQSYPDAPQFTWNVSDEFRPISSGDRETELRVVHKVHTEGAWCSAGSVPLKTEDIITS
ncbi:MAG: phytanoyl-CoA dioxygenase family protein [Phototrophicaceae bacterium]|jgi:ectoine hydroxylase-related dioxygenase (phytanoyl-CoA dioxygenase family)